VGDEMQRSTLDLLAIGAPSSPSAEVVVVSSLITDWRVSRAPDRGICQFASANWPGSRWSDDRAA